MASWFGHTQTVASIGKSVTTVAGGIICLESNLSNFMKKVIYYEGFFQRTSAKLPEDVTYAAKKLLRRCHEYREAIREELQSNVAYVADAGRWAIGLEDWNTKMDKRMAQISELVVLANSLLAEYAVTGELRGAVDDLSAYLNVITSTIVLQDDALFRDSIKQTQQARPSYKPSNAPRPMSPLVVPSSTTATTTTVVLAIDEDDDDDEASPEDEDRLNPFNVIIGGDAAAATDKQVPRTSPIAIPKKTMTVPPPSHGAATSIGSNSSCRSHSNSFTSDYCHLEREYGDELNEMTSFTTTAGKRPQHGKGVKSTKPKPYENAVYDLTVSFDFQKERMSNPFVSKTFAMDRKTSRDEHTIAEEDHVMDASPRRVEEGGGDDDDYDAPSPRRDDDGLEHVIAMAVRATAEMEMPPQPSAVASSPLSVVAEEHVLDER
ncbi:Aste57867_17872 [Aphanomyces stellatus]|uniref:Aste57867_17872 protein n=1 Tax=Aphanomyces stellatus TaxID=120398 RepID=A0A485L9W7_9STRA|nr:hypothetical protein As57867_017811 [Aphanomyces stellatus]VFT94615.1 Aste57867_17872 [Aphanomyces stellatus]